MLRILIDMDDVMADTIARFLEWYERDYGIRSFKRTITWKKI